MFEGDLTVIQHNGAFVHVEFYNPESQHIESALLPIDELYYPDLAAGALILQLMS